MVYPQFTLRPSQGAPAQKPLGPPGIRPTTSPTIRMNTTSATARLGKASQSSYLPPIRRDIGHPHNRQRPVIRSGIAISNELTRAHVTPARVLNAAVAFYANTMLGIARRKGQGMPLAGCREMRLYPQQAGVVIRVPRQRGQSPRTGCTARGDTEGANLQGIFTGQSRARMPLRWLL